MKYTCLLILMSLLLLPGCQTPDDSSQLPEKKPRPVTVRKLEVQSTPPSALVAASVASWKTEDIGFEVGGRIEWVAEPNVNIEGRIIDAKGDEIVPGSPIARIDDERFQLQVESAKAEVTRAEQSIKASEIELEKSIPSQMEAAQAEAKLAKTEYERSLRLFNQNAGAEADVDRDEARLRTAEAQIEQLEASKKAKMAELQSLQSQLRQANKALRDAERSAEDCVLYSSFRGQIADVEVVPGSVVSAGQAVATVQMMDPIKIELEVSAEDSRRLRERQRIPIWVADADGQLSEKDGYLYLIDAVADQQMRTYTITLLMMNERIGNQQEGESSVATTDQCWRVDFSFLPGAEEGKLFAPEPAIRTDSEGPYLWSIVGVTKHDSLPTSGMVKVKKLRIAIGESKVPFLGNWIFQEIRVLDQDFDPHLNLIAGQLTVDDGEANDWSGDEIRISREGQWLVRPGDIVKVDLSNRELEPGIYVPMNAIVYQSGDTSLFLIDDSTETPTVTKVPIQVLDEDDNTHPHAIKRVSSLDPSVKLEGRQYVYQGAHFLRDGEPVKVVAESEDRQ